ncbi:MAG: pirin family protein [Candidatus Marinimicrobia bacterium]|nr:pirin family protein [Candidatus Neomarinimicrobiota bacterium]MCF7828455.1 pirin family protein [Candidatus Neomarinimicrobiota bacterium]MCF7880951.1 pirin family protein [Candidatus Neomarinimicrobiota bacterium]
MIRKIPAEDRHYQEMGWLKTHWLFSFSNYFDPENVQFGNLRVFNDDYVEPHSGFQTHPHSEMEIVTIVMSGTITHKDSMGNEISISPGEIQRMTAGTGVRHSEMNDGDDPLKFYQIWFIPDEKGLEPDYGQKKFATEAYRNSLTPVVSSDSQNGALDINASITIYRSIADPGQTFEYPIEENRGVFLYVTDGELDINGTTFSTKDQARVSEESKIVIEAKQETQFIMIDVKMSE